MRPLPFAVIVLAAAGTVARADEPASTDATGDDASRTAAAEARDHAKAGDYLAAAAAFKRAHAADPLPEYQCNTGVAYWKARDLPRAHLYLAQCLTRGSHLDAAFLDQVREVLAAVEDRLRAGDFTPLDLVVSPAATNVKISAFDADDTFVGPRLVWLPFGTHRVELTATGHVPFVRDVVAERHEILTLRVTLAEEEPPEVVPEQPPPNVLRNPFDGEPSPEGDTPPVALEPERRSAVPAWIATGATIVAGTASLVLYGAASDAAEQAGALELDEGYEEQAAKARRLRNATYAGIAVTTVGVVASIYLWSRAWPRSPARPAVEVRGDGAAVWLGGAF